MDIKRIKSLAGIVQPKTEFQTNQMLNEATIIPQDADLDQLGAMFDAAKRALGLVNRLKNPVDRKRHLSAVFSNLNKIRAALVRAMEAEDVKIAGIQAMTDVSAAQPE